MKSKLIGLVVCATLFGTATLLGGVSRASAAIMDVTYTGTVYQGTDTLGVFGGGSLVGLSWVATYTFDTSLGFPASSSISNSVIGGSAYSYAPTSPVLSSMITINGVGRAVDGSYHGEIYAYNVGYSSEHEHYAQNYSSVQTEYLQNYIVSNNGSLPASITTPFTHTVDANDHAFELYYLGNGTGSEAIYANLATLTVSDHVAAVPEPATWAMMLLGFAGVGFAAYRKRKNGTFTMAAA